MASAVEYLGGTKGEEAKWKVYKTMIASFSIFYVCQGYFQIVTHSYLKDIPADFDDIILHVVAVAK